MSRFRNIAPMLLVAALPACGEATPERSVGQTVSLETPAPDATPLAHGQEPMDSIEGDDDYLNDAQVVPDEQIVETNVI